MFPFLCRFALKHLPAFVAVRNDRDVRGVALVADACAQRFVAYPSKATYPTRTGVHSNTVFALALALDYAAACRQQKLAETVGKTARRWYMDDRDCQAWEPSGEDVGAHWLTTFATLVLESQGKPEAPPLDSAKRRALGTQ